MSCTKAISLNNETKCNPGVSFNALLERSRRYSGKEVPWTDDARKRTKQLLHSTPTRHTSFWTSVKFYEILKCNSTAKVDVPLPLPGLECKYIPHGGLFTRRRRATTMPGIGGLGGWGLSVSRKRVIYAIRLESWFDKCIGNLWVNDMEEIHHPRCHSICDIERVSLLYPFQAQEWIDVALFAEEGALPKGRLLLEEAQGRQDDAGGSHETQSTRHWGECVVGGWLDGWTDGVS